MSKDWRCELCKAPKGQPCSNTIRPGEPLPGRDEHLARSLPPGRSKATTDTNPAVCVAGNVIPGALRRGTA